jgi:hypothetical protein
MKLLAVAALFLLQAQAAEPAPSQALIERFIAALPDQDAFSAGAQQVDPAELARLAALNPGKEAQVGAILKSNLACTGPAIASGSRRMLATIARNLGGARVEKLISFYGGPDYAAFGALAARMEGQPKPGAADSAAMAKYMETYPLQAFHDQLGRAGEIIAADPGFMESAMKCASEQVEAMEKAGLKAN